MNESILLVAQTVKTFDGWVSLNYLPEDMPKVSISSAYTPSTQASQNAVVTAVAPVVTGVAGTVGTVTTGLGSLLGVKR